MSWFVGELSGYQAIHLSIITSPPRVKITRLTVLIVEDILYIDFTYIGRGHSIFLNSWKPSWLFPNLPFLKNHAPKVVIKNHLHLRCLILSTLLSLTNQLILIIIIIINKPMYIDSAMFRASGALESCCQSV